MGETYSYDFGFNNSIALLLVFSSILLWALWGYKTESQKVGLVRGAEPEGHKFLWYLIGTYTVLMTLIIVFVGDEIDEVLESRYFLRYYYALDIGKKGYVDFAYGYGPLMLYPPYWLHKLTTLSIPVCYTIILWLYHTIGIILTYDIVMCMNLNKSEKKWILISVYLSIFLYASGGGIHYQLLRFALPIWFILKISNLTIHLNRGSYISFVSLFVPSIAFLLNFLLSPEIGLAFCLSCLFLLILMYYCSRNVSVILESVLLLLTLIAAYFIFPEIFVYIKAFSGGYYNFPFTFNFVLIIFLVSILIVSYNFGALLQDIEGNISNIGILIISFSLLPACLGRCDPGHLLWNGLLILPFAYIILSHKYSMPKWCVIIVFLLFLSPNMYILKFYSADIVAGILKNNINYFEKNKTKFSKHQETVINDVIRKISQPYPFDISELNDIAVPFFDREMAVQLTKDRKMTDLYYENIYNKVAVDNDIKELQEKGVKYLLLPSGWEERFLPTIDYEVIYLVLLAYYPFAARYNGNEVYLPLIKYINQNYTLSKMGNEWELWCRKETK